MQSLLYFNKKYLNVLMINNKKIYLSEEVPPMWIISHYKLRVKGRLGNLLTLLYVERLWNIYIRGQYLN